MVSIEQIIQQEFNPFDPISFKSGHFWQEETQAKFQIIDSIHQKELNQMTNVIHLTQRDHHTRTVLLTGDKGSGKSYFLGRLKETLNQDVFFAYIAPWTDSEHIWRHTLRYTVDSLMYNPKGQKQSQLLLWLKELAVFKNPNLINQILGDRRVFIRNLRSAYPAGIYQAKSFFGVLYDLTNPELYPIACDWLRGDDLDEEDLQLLGIKRSIDSEEAARHILENFGRISTSTKPIILCFDQVENGEPRDAEGIVNLQPLMSVNTTFHNEKFKNFVIIISIVRDNWQKAGRKIEQSDLDRIETAISLKSITLNQAEQLWASRLYPLHCQAKPQPTSVIYPLDAKVLESQYPGGKVNIRDALQLGQKLFLEYKTGKYKSSEPIKNVPEEKSELLKTTSTELNLILDEERLESVKTVSEPIKDVSADFNLSWQYELKKNQEYVSKMRQYSAVERLAMLRNILNLFQVQRIKVNFLPSQKYKSYSLSYQQSQNSPKIGIVWMEEPNLTNFCNIMKVCLKVVQNKLCDTLYLIRAERLGTAANKGYQVYTKVFKNSPHQHIIPDLASLHDLVTYTKLLNSVNSGELIIAGKTPTMEEFKTLVRQEKVLENCSLLQELDLIQTIQTTEEAETHSNLQPVQDFMMNIMKTQQMLAYQSLVNTTVSQFPKIKDNQINQVVEQLCDQNKIQILNPSDSYEKQTIYLVV
ncbi:MAG: P-loop NTPase fold protein [Microcoleaceae cyanobacterium]